MRGTLIEHQPKRGKKTFGYSIFLGRDEKGKQLLRVKRGFAKKSEAEDALRDAITQLQNPTVPQEPITTAAMEHTVTLEPSCPTFAVFFDFWIKNYKSKCAPKTLERYWELGAYALRHLGHLRLDQIGVAEMDDMLLALERCGGRKTEGFPAGRPLAIKTVREIAFLVAGCLKKAVSRKLMNESPFDGDVQVPDAKRKEAPWLNASQLDTLLEAAAGTRLYPLILLASATGCRRGELLALTWPDLDFQTGILNVCKSLEETRKGVRIKSTKSGKSRQFSVPEDVLAILADWRMQQAEDRRMYGSDYASHNLIFCRPDGEYYKPDKVSVRVTELATKAGLDGMGLHSLRHSHASQLLSDGAPIPAVAKRLGHANANVTLAIYAHALPVDEEAAAELWNNSLAKVIAKKRTGERLSQVITKRTKMPRELHNVKKIR